MDQVFLSYAREDTRIAEELARLLESNGSRVWWDRRMVAGADIHAVIDQQLASSLAAIVLWSPSSIASHWVRGEAEIALGLNKLIPVKIAACDVPINFRHLHTPEIYKSRRDLRDLAGLLAEQFRARAAPGHQGFSRDDSNEKESGRFLQLANTLVDGTAGLRATMAAGRELGEKHPVWGSLTLAAGMLFGVIIAAGALSLVQMAFDNRQGWERFALQAVVATWAFLDAWRSVWVASAKMRDRAARWRFRG